MKGGRISINKLILGIVAVVVLIIVIMGVTGQFNKFSFWANLFPDFEEEFLEGEAILGYNLPRGELEYYTGTSWKEIDSTKEIFALGDYEFNPKNVRENFREFYFDGKRPENLLLNVSEFKIWRLHFDHKRTLEIDEIMKENYVGDSEYDSIKDDQVRKFSPTRFLLKYSGVLEKYIWQGNVGSSAPIAVEFLNYYSPFIEKTIFWRDQFLKGKDCEKFLKLNLSSGETNYFVERIEDYLYVELTEPVYPGTSEKWKNESCFSFLEIEDTSDWVNPAKVEIEYLEDPFIGFRENVKWVWHPSVDEFGKPAQGGWYYVSEDSLRGFLKIENFYEGLERFSLMVNGGDNDENIKVYIYEGENKGNSLRFTDGILNSDGTLEKEIEFIDKITTLYNRYLGAPEKEIITIDDLGDSNFKLGGVETIDHFNIPWPPGTGNLRDIQVMKIFCGELFTQLYLLTPSGSYPSWNDYLIFVETEYLGDKIYQEIFEGFSNSLGIPVRTISEIIDFENYHIPVNEFISRLEYEELEDLFSGEISCTN